jgi:hypothetical protein
MKPLILAPLCLLLFACDSTPEAGASASAAATAPVTHAPPAPPPPSASTEASASAPVLPGTALKDVLKDVKSIMALGRASGPMGVMISDKKDVAAILAALGTDQSLKKPFESKCMTPTKLDFQSKAGHSLGALGFCDTDTTFAKARFDGSGATQAEVVVKEPAAFKAALTKAGAIK